VIKVAILNDLRAPFGLHPSPTQQMERTEPPEANTGGGVKMEHFKVRHFLPGCGPKELNQLGGIASLTDLIFCDLVFASFCEIQSSAT
jgi:hypothetical protein